LACALTGIGWGYAYWAPNASFGLGSIFHGTLELGEPIRTWELTRSDADSADAVVLAASSHSDPQLAVGDLENLTTPCGDGVVLEVIDSYPLIRGGDNLTVQLSLTLPPAPAGSAAWYAVSDEAGAILADGRLDVSGSSAAPDTTVTEPIPPQVTELNVLTGYELARCDGSVDLRQDYGGHRLEVAQT
jgi:hypothetical protein